MPKDVMVLARRLTSDPELLRLIEREYGGQEIEGLGDEANWCHELGDFIVKYADGIKQRATAVLGRKGMTTQAYARGCKLKEEGLDAMEASAYF